MGVPVKAEIRPLEPDPGNAGGGSKKTILYIALSPLKKEVKDGKDRIFWHC